MTATIDMSQHHSELNNTSITSTNENNPISNRTITFVDKGSRKAEYIYLKHNHDIQGAMDFLNDAEKSQRPSLIISITGGAKYFSMERRFLDAFRRGLLEVAHNTGAWIITGGMNEGCMKYVGEITRRNPHYSRPIHLIGITSWGSIANREKIDYNSANSNYSVSCNIGKREASLEPNHKKFVFIDDESTGFGGEVIFRAKLEKALFDGSIEWNNSSRTRATPVVLIVVGGGTNALRTIFEAVLNNDIPVIFLKGTEGCSDLFEDATGSYAKYCKKNKIFTTQPNDISNDSQVESGEFRKELLRIIDNHQNEKVKMFSPFDDHRKDYFEKFYKCIRDKSNLLKFIDFNDCNPMQPGIDLVILDALFSAVSNIPSTNVKLTNEHKANQLRLALKLNRVDIAKSYINTWDMTKNVNNEQNTQTNKMFKEALLNSQVEFVQLFLEYDFSLTNFFRFENNLRTFLEPTRKKISELANSHNSQFQTLYAAIKNYIEKDGGPDGSIDFRIERSSRSLSKRTSDGLVDVNKLLFVWSLVSGKHKLALLFWSHWKYKIGTALVATLCDRVFAKKYNVATYDHNADVFEKLAVQVLNTFYQYDPVNCTEAIIMENPVYGNLTWLELAINAEAKEFIAQEAVQNVFDKIWFGYITRPISQRKIIFSTFMLWYSGFLQYNSQLTQRDQSYKDRCMPDNADPTSPQTSDQEEFKLLRTGYARTKRHQKRKQKTEENSDRRDKRKSECGKYLKNIYYFVNAPLVVYLYNLYFHVTFLILFSYMILCDFFPLYEFSTNPCKSMLNLSDHRDDSNQDNENQLTIHRTLTGMETKINASNSYGLQRRKFPSMTEIIITIWMFTLLCEEIRQIWVIEAYSMRTVLIDYFKSSWNILDALSIVLFLIGLILRYIPNAECFCIARIVLSVDLTLWFIRSLETLTAVQSLGPKLIMIGDMMKDLYSFLIILTVFTFAFGVSFHSLIYGVQKFSWHLPRQVLNLAYWQIFGEPDILESFEHNYTKHGYVAFILLVTYMAIVSILLINLLIAMFSFTFQRLQVDTDLLWRFQRYSLLCQYLSRPSLPPPLIIFCHIWRLTIFLLSKCIKLRCIQEIYQKHIRRNTYKVPYEQEKSEKIINAEHSFGEDVYYKHFQTNLKLDDGASSVKEHTDVTGREILFKIEMLEEQIQSIIQLQNNSFQNTLHKNNEECLVPNLKDMLDRSSIQTTLLGKMIRQSNDSSEADA